MNYVRRVFVAVTLISMAAFITGCGGGGGGQQTQTTTEQTESTSEPSDPGSLVATVNYDGPAPKPEEVDASGNDECGVDSIEQYKMKVNNGKLNEAVVAVESGPSGFEVSSPGEATIDQQNCQYVPNVLTLKAGQTLKIMDSDPKLHNVRATRDGKQLFNYSTFKGQTKEASFDEAGVFNLECNVHPWMNASVYVTDHGKASTTDEKGSATLSELPPGDYTITVWHPELGSKTEDVSISEGEESSIDVTFSG